MNRMYPPFRNDSQTPCSVAPNTATTGFSSPADDYVMQPLSLDDLVGVGRPSIFFFRADTDDLVGHGIEKGDVLVVDRALTPAKGSLVIARIDAELLIFSYDINANGFGFLNSSDASKKPLFLDDIDGFMDKEIWGVITYNLHRQIS